VMRPDELPAAAPDFAGLGFVHPQAGGRLCPSAESGTAVTGAAAHPEIAGGPACLRARRPGIASEGASDCGATVVHSDPRSASSGRRFR
jgi:hypothetical protein